MFNSIFPKIHKEGYKFLAISILITFIVLFFSKFLGFILILITVWVYYFFRDPERFSINDESYLVSPADGLITDFIECIDVDINNNVWIGTSQGIQKFDGVNWIQLGNTNAHNSTSVYAAFDPKLFFINNVLHLTYCQPQAGTTYIRIENFVNNNWNTKIFSPLFMSILFLIVTDF